MTETEFKVGDKLVCVKATTDPENLLTLGKIYTSTKDSYTNSEGFSYVFVVDDRGWNHPWFTNRFKIYEEPKAMPD